METKEEEENNDDDDDDDKDVLLLRLHCLSAEAERLLMRLSDLIWSNLI